MNFSKHDFISVDTMVASVVRLVGDIDTKKIPKGRYESFAYRALLDLSIDTFFNKKRIDAPVPHDLQYELPANTFNVKEVYVYNGDTCNFSSAQKVWYKPNYFTRGNGFFAKNRGQANTIDPFYPANRELVHLNNSNVMVRREDKLAQRLLYYSIENGVVYLSPSCRSYQNIHVVAYGTNTTIGEVPLIPLMLQNAVEDYCCEFATRELINIEPQKYAVMNRIYSDRMQKSGMNGSWHEAVMRIKRMDKGQRDDWAEYYSRWSW